MDKKEVKEKIEKGYLRARVMFEIIGNPKEYVEKAITSVIKKIKIDSKIEFLSEEYGEPEITKDELWGVFCEAEILAPNLYAISWLCLNYSPASVEILEPIKFNFNDKMMSDLFNDFIGHVHFMNTKNIENNSVVKSLQRNLNAMTRNAVLLAINSGEKTADEIGKMIGVQNGADVEPVLDAMIKEKRLEKIENKYKRIK